MKRTTKYTHIIARTNTYLKQLSIQTCQKMCNNTLSWAWRRLGDEHKGLINIYDQQSFELWTQVINGVRRISSPIPLTERDHDALNSLRGELLDRMEIYRNRIEYGVFPDYIRDDFDCRELALILIDLPEFLQGDNIRELYIKHQKRLHTYAAEILKEMPEDFDGTGIDTNNSVFQIRVDYEHKKSNSKAIKYLLEGICDIKSQTTKRHRSIYASDMKVIEDFNDWKQKVKKRDITLGNDKNESSEKALKALQNYLSKIKIPE